MSAPDLVVHVGFGGSAAVVGAALARLRPSLVASGLDERLITRPDASPPFDPSEITPFASIDPDGVAALVSAAGASRAVVVLSPQRQDRLLEHAYAEAIRGGAGHPLDAQFPRRFEVLLDYRPLVARLGSIVGVAGVRVLPFEQDLDATVRELVAGLATEESAEPDELDEPVDLAPLVGWSPPSMYSARGVRIARAMNAFLDTEAERDRVRTFVLDNHAVAVTATPKLLARPGRQRIVQAHRGPNRALLADSAQVRAAASG